MTTREDALRAAADMLDEQAYQADRTANALSTGRTGRNPIGIETVQARVLRDAAYEIRTLAIEGAE